MKAIRCIEKLTLALFLCLGLGTQLPAADINDAVQKLDNKNGKCPCFDEADLADVIAGAANPSCTYTFNVDRRVRIFDEDAPSNQAFTRAGVACFGPKVKGGNAAGLPGAGSFAMYDTEGQDCRKSIIRVANDCR